MKVLTVRQPWATLICSGVKDIENRNWSTRYRGSLLIQASAHLPPHRQWQQAREFCWVRGVDLPSPETLSLGGIVGLVNLDDCVYHSDSKWFEGDVGWKLSGAIALPLIPIVGRLGLFDCPHEILWRLHEVIPADRLR